MPIDRRNFFAASALGTLTALHQLAGAKPHHAPKAKRAIQISLVGGMSHIDSFDYSPAMKNSGLTWNQATLDRFLADPMGVVPGTKMAYPGLKDAAKRRAMIEYLKTL